MILGVCFLSMGYLIGKDNLFDNAIIELAEEYGKFTESAKGKRG